MCVLLGLPYAQIQAMLQEMAMPLTDEQLNQLMDLSMEEKCSGLNGISPKLVDPHILSDAMMIHAVD